MKKFLMILFVFVLLSGCASQKAADVLRLSGKSYDAFEQDFDTLSKTSLQREWMLRRAISDEALKQDVAGMSSISPDLAILLVKKHLNDYQKDVQAIDDQRNLHLRSLVNSKMGKKLLEAGIDYHTNGVSADEVEAFLMNQALPSITEIIQSRSAPAATTVPTAPAK